MRGYLVIAILFVVQCLPGMPIDTGLIRKQLQQASLLNEAKDFAQAEQIAQNTLAALRESTITVIDLEIGFIHILGDCALQQSHYEEALKYYEEATSILNHEETKNQPLVVENLNKVGNYFREIKDYEQALQYLNQGLELGKQIFSLQDLKVADIYNNIAICLNFIGDYDKALEYNQQSLSIRLDQLPKPHPKIAQSYNNLGLCWLKKIDYPNALNAFQRALSIYEDYYQKDHLDIADVHLNIGTIYFEEQNPELFAEYEKALRVYQRILDKNHPSIALVYNNLANAHAQQNNFELASRFYQQALDILMSNYGSVHPDVAMAYYNIGVSHFFAAEDEQAKQAFMQCFLALNYRPSAEPNFNEINDHQILLRLLKSVSELEIEVYNLTQDTDNLIRAFESYRKIDQLLDYLRTRYEAVGSKLALADRAHDLYEYGIMLAMALYQLTDDQAYLYESLQFSEKSKAILLLEGLRKSEAQAYSGIPPEVVNQVKSLETSIAELEKKRYLTWQNQSPQQRNIVDSLNNLIFEKTQKVSQTIASIEENYPQYFELRYNTATVAVPTIQKELLSPNQTIVEYFLGTGNLYIFVINQEDFQVITIDVDEEIYNWMATYDQTIKGFATASSQDLSYYLESYSFAAHKLYKILIEPIEHLLQEQVIIIPDDELGYLSYGALLSEYPADHQAIESHAYLILDYALSYNYSISLLKEMIEKSKKKSARTYLGLAPEFGQDNTTGLSPLNYNELEIERINQLVRGDILANEAATKAHFLEVQSNYKILHLATHGKANTQEGDYSFLAFSETPEISGSEALLFVKEIYNISTPADMVLLSACETNVGELQKGEGIASIARSFSYAGAKSLITTQWSIDDKATSDLMQLFFQQLKQGLPKDLAMQAAMLQFLEKNNKVKAHPYYWASFVAIGDMESVNLRTGIPVWFWSLSAVILLFLMYFWMQRKRNVSRKT